MDQEASEVFDALEVLEDKIPLETKMSLCHIAGYVTRHDDQDEMELLNVTTFYYQKYGNYTKDLDRGGLKVPTDSSCQWTFFSYILFNAVKDKVCRKSLCNSFVLISDVFLFLGSL